MRGRRIAWGVVAAVVALGAPVLPGVRASESAEAVECVTAPLSAHTYRSLARSAQTPDDDVVPEGERPALDESTEILRLANLSDSHIIDDEASAVYYHQETEIPLDPTIGNNSAQRLQEEFTDEVLNAMVGTLNACSEEDALALMVATGDLTDNAQLNEVRRYIDNLAGTSGHPTAYEEHCGYATVHSNGTPKAGFDLDGDGEAACPLPDDVLAVPTGRVTSDARGYQPDPDVQLLDRFRPTVSLRQIVESQIAATTNPDGPSSVFAPGLPAELRCDSTVTAGCPNARLGVPHYAAFGNHDGYPRGTVTFNQAFQAGPASNGRYWLESQREFINEYFRSSGEGADVAHGFAHAGARLDDADDRNDGYYAFDENGVRIVVLNTIHDGVVEEVHGGGQVTEATGGHLTGNEATLTLALETGALDDAQFAWLQGELDAAQKAGQPVLVFSHHPDVSFSESRLPEPIVGKSAAEVNHELGKRGNVVAWIAGHTHRHRVRACVGACTVNGRDSDVAHGFWRIETASLVDFPQEGRIIELHDVDPDPQAASYAVVATTLAPDRADPMVEASYELSIAEDNCSTAAVMGGPMASGPYDEQRLIEFGRNAQTMILGDDDGPARCPGDVENDPDGPAGTPLDQDVVLLP